MMTSPCTSSNRYDLDTSLQSPLLLIDSQFIKYYIAPGMAKQNTLFNYFDFKAEQKEFGRTFHGGTNARGRRKSVRPLACGQWIHLVLKSSKAKGAYSLRNAKHRIWISQLIKKKARRFGVTIGDFVNMGNHLHLKVKISSRRLFQAFLKSVTALISRKVTGARKGKPFGKFWDGLAYTRVLKSRKEVLYLNGYFRANETEAERGYRAREKVLDEFRNWLRKLKRQRISSLDPPSSLK